ncbi:hypothetical protein EV421DRAFT_2040769 [Armillaria borealis]|uniref:Uncharacterized protein n=1 Tax=Armillaria borealis TaxID=47425 RepID=A0AA39IXF8_9AGAR|nr:hypothetical protein EV421DRAFT_2040769 [Armillaria borealis]
MSIVRRACYAKFKDLMESIYALLDQTDVEAEKKTLPQEELEVYIFATIAKALDLGRSTKLDRKVDLFAFGVDSLYIIGDEDTEKFTEGARIENSWYMSIRRWRNKLADYNLQLQSGGTQVVGNRHKTVMLALLDKWNAKVVQITARTEPTDARVILLTDFAGKTIVEVVLNLKNPATVVYHIVNPNTKAHWKGTLVGLVWSKSDEDGKKKSAIKLLPFFQETTKIAPILKKAPAM